MPIKTEVLAAIKGGEITPAFRRWKKATVRTGGTLQTALGQLSVVQIDQVGKSSISASDAKRAGDLCLELKGEKDKFKTNVRKLKALGLTESQEIGYRILPRGRVILGAARSRG